MLDEDDWNFSEAVWQLLENLCTMVGVVSFVVVVAFLLGRYT